MYWNVVKVNPTKYLILEVKFSDGLQGVVKFKPSHLTGVFESLKDKNYFKQVFISPYGAVTWPGELDLAPDAMYAAIKQNGEWVLS